MLKARKAIFTAILEALLKMYEQLRLRTGTSSGYGLVRRHKAVRHSSVLDRSPSPPRPARPVKIDGIHAGMRR